MSLDYPGAVSTALYGMNNRGDIVGAYDNPANFFHGFVYKNGIFASIDGPGAAFTEIRGINEEGDIAGTFITLEAVLANAPGGGFQGLFQKNGASLTTVNIPGHLNTILERIKPSGLIYGCYHDKGSDNSPQETMHGIIIQGGNLPQVSFDAMPDGTTMNVGGDSKGNRYTGMWYDFTKVYIAPTSSRMASDPISTFPGAT